MLVTSGDRAPLEHSLGHLASQYIFVQVLYTCTSLKFSRSVNRPGTNNVKNNVLDIVRSFICSFFCLFIRSSFVRSFICLICMKKCPYYVNILLNNLIYIKIKFYGGNYLRSDSYNNMHKTMYCTCTVCKLLLESCNLPLQK